MSKEIERKFLIKDNINIYGYIVDKPKDIIGDYYFNETTRLRIINTKENETKQFITVKSLETLERQEHEYEINCITDLPTPLLQKERYYYDYYNHVFEVNLYDLYYYVDGIDEVQHSKLKLVEVELQDKNEPVILPDFVGKEVTDDLRFYNYNIFKSLLRQTDKV